jgi:glutathione synthase
MAGPEAVYTAYPPSLAPAQQEYLVQRVKDWSIQHGLAVRPSSSLLVKEADPHAVLATNAPVTLFPSPFPKSCFDHAREIQAVYNELYAAIANDEEWLEELVRE